VIISQPTEVERKSKDASMMGLVESVTLGPIEFEKLNYNHYKPSKVKSKKDLQNGGRSSADTQERKSIEMTGMENSFVS